MSKRLTIGELIDKYTTDPDSGYRRLRHVTRQNTDSLLRRIRADIGFVAITEDDFDARFIMRLHEQWMERGVSTAHALMAQLRTMATFGATLLKNKQCRELKVTLHDMKFKNGKAREVIMTVAQSDLIRNHARTAQLASMALAQALQFECAFRQKDVIGEWVPEDEPGESDVRCIGNRARRLKWLRGVTWNEIDDHLVLRHITSKKLKPVTHHLTLAPAVLDELARAYPGFARGDGTYDRAALPKSGPIVVNEKSGRPWRTPEFRETWRKIARSAGIPDHIQNRDNRASAVTEATANGASLEQAKELAGHSDIATTQIYSRGREEKGRQAQATRVANRKTQG